MGAAVIGIIGASEIHAVDGVRDAARGVVPDPATLHRRALRMSALAALAACLTLWALPAPAQEFVALPGPVPDEDFYRAVACAAAPGGPCRKPLLRWPQARRDGITVTLATVTPSLSPDRRAVFEAGLAEAIAQINALAAGIHLDRVTTAGADIGIHVVATAPGQVMQDTGVASLDGNVLPLGRVALRVRDGAIQDAVIAVSARARPREIASILLEEITQAMGLMTDISGPAQLGSIFSEDANFVVRLEGQDAMALRRHYAADVTAEGVE